VTFRRFSFWGFPSLEPLLIIFVELKDWLRKCYSVSEVVGYIFFRFEEQEPAGTRSFFTEIIASISDIKFARGGRYILSRDYMTLKVVIVISRLHVC
jgi:hypothetical protein